MALPALLFALMLGQEAIATGTPEAPAPAAQPAPTGVQAEYTPEGAPKDDYNFVAWCHGVLSGHMALAERIQPVLPLDDAQQKIGKAYLKGYEEALAAGRRGRSAAELDAADAIRAAARANWNTAMKADLQLGADTYLAWQLPGRCEHAAKRVAGRTDLFRMIADPSSDDETVGTGSASADEAMPASPSAARTTPAPAAVAAPAPESTAPVFTPASAPASPDAPLATSAELTAADSAPAAPAEAPLAAVFTTPDPVPAAEEPAPAEIQTVAAADPAPAVEAPKPEAKPADRRIVRMPQKGRLFPWGKRE